MPSRALLVALALVVLAGCAGTSVFEQCVQHSVDEGVAEDRAEQACEDAVGREQNG